jgi:threonine dehydrogenase-like Zn-dependent dehydrogenase
VSPRPQALVYEDEPLRFGAARVASSLRAGAGGSVGPLAHHTDAEKPELPGPDWVRIQPRLSGICGSDLAAVDGRSSRWFEPVISLPFVPGHEVVADHEDRRVVVEPVLGCVARGISPPCDACARGDLGNCERLAHGDLEPGLQTGFCHSTGGGWSTSMVAHPSQLHEVPPEMDDRAAVMVEPTACAVHGALAAGVSPGDAVAVIGAGTMGLAAVAALARWSPPASLVVGAKHPHQQALAVELAGAVPATAVAPGELLRAARRVTGSMLLGTGGHQRVTGGVDVTVDCVGSAESLRAALAVTRCGSGRSSWWAPTPTAPRPCRARR